MCLPLFVSETPPLTPCILSAQVEPSHSRITSFAPARVVAWAVKYDCQLICQSEDAKMRSLRKVELSIQYLRLIKPGGDCQGSATAWRPETGRRWRADMSSCGGGTQLA